jgi:hypothetical protein
MTHPRTNTTEKYLVVNENNEIVAKFRLKSTALYFIQKKGNWYNSKLRVVVVPLE